MSVPFFGSCMLFGDVPLEWARLETATRLTFTTPQRDRLLWTFNSYLAERIRRQHDVPVRDLRHRLIDMADTAQRLARLVNEYTDKGQTARARARQFSQVDPATLTWALRAWSLASRAASQEIPSQTAGRRDKNTTLDWLIREWHAIYRQAGGAGKGCWKDPISGQYRGRFLALLDGAQWQAVETLSRKTLATMPGDKHRQTLLARRQAVKKLLASLKTPRVTLAKRINDTLNHHA